MAVCVHRWGGIGEDGLCMCTGEGFLEGCWVVVTWEYGGETAGQCPRRTEPRGYGNLHAAVVGRWYEGGNFKLTDRGIRGITRGIMLLKDGRGHRQRGMQVSRQPA